MNYGISIVILSPNQIMLKEVRDSSPLTGVIYLKFKLFHKKLTLAYISVFVKTQQKGVKAQ